jgi:uncharacterized protein YjbJ (UPF0337 family)
MEGKVLKNHWSELRDKISDWWDDLTDDDLDIINGNQEQLIAVLQERYGYTRNLAFGKVKVRMASYHPKGERREKRFHKDISVLQYPSYDIDDWPEVNNGQKKFSRSRAKDTRPGFATQHK